jgi:hypothetical protein
MSEKSDPRRRTQALQGRFSELVEELRNDIPTFRIALDRVKSMI